MIRAGLTGGLASGKSFVGRLLQSLGCYVIRADDLGHKVLLVGGEAHDAVVQHFGKVILGSDGEIDRKRLAAEVFGEPERLAELNALVHPAVFRLEDEFLAKVQKKDPNAIAVVEAAILIETGNYRTFDRLIVVICTEEQHIARAVRRDGCTREEALARLRSQLSDSEKSKYADYIIDTSGPKQDTVNQVEGVYRSLRQLADERCAVTPAHGL